MSTKFSNFFQKIRPPQENPKSAPATRDERESRKKDLPNFLTKRDEKSKF